MTQGAEWKSRLICYISFICEKIHKVWFKNLWNWLCNSDLKIFYLLPLLPFGPSPGPQGAWTQKMVLLHMPFMQVTHTPNLVEFRKKKKKKKIDRATPHGTPKSHPWGMTQAAKWKSHLICFISFICEKTHKVWFKNLWNWLSNWNLMIFNYIWPFGPSPGPQGAGQKKMCHCTPHSCEQLTHKIWLDFVQWFRRR